MQIEHNTIVSFHYQVETADGEPVDGSAGREPLVYLHGHSQIVPGLEKMMAGKRAGEHIDATVAPAEAYGEHDAELDLTVPLDAFPDEIQPQLQEGVQFQAEHPSQAEAVVLYTVVGREEDRVLVSGNHPLAGQTLVFAVDVVSVRPATEEELAHGHAHGPGGAH